MALTDPSARKVHHEWSLDQKAPDAAKPLPRGVIRIEAGGDPARPFWGANTRVYVFVDGEPVCELPYTEIGVTGKPQQAGVVRLELLASECEVRGVG